MKQRKLNVTYRDLERKDYPYIEKIIRDTWNYDSICDRPSTAKQMAKVYLRGCLAQKTYARVAVCRDRVVGIIVGQYGKDRKMNPGMHISSFFSGLRLMMDGDGRKVAKQFRGFEKTDRDMLESCGKKFDGEVVFFAVSKAVRGCGVGKELWGQLRGYFRAKSAESIYVYTDNTCNYKFYESQEFERLDCRELLVSPGGQRFRLEMYLHEYNF